MCIQILTHQIEGLRAEMVKLAERKGSLCDPQVIALSQQLDQLLVTMQRLTKKTPPIESTEAKVISHQE
ncbi:MAG: Spo0E family sporulation regulatory protein-aspartic acid phosphatase [Tumebacillaceae bacterium]